MESNQGGGGGGVCVCVCVCVCVVCVCVCVCMRERPLIPGSDARLMSRIQAVEMRAKSLQLYWLPGPKPWANSWWADVWGPCAF